MSLLLNIYERSLIKMRTLIIRKLKVCFISKESKGKQLIPVFNEFLYAADRNRMLKSIGHDFENIKICNKKRPMLYQSFIFLTMHIIPIFDRTI